MICIVLTCMRSSLPNQTWSRECMCQIANAARKANTFLNMHCTDRPQAFQPLRMQLSILFQPRLCFVAVVQISRSSSKGAAKYSLAIMRVLQFHCSAAGGPKGTASCTSSSSSSSFPCNMQFKYSNSRMLKTSAGNSSISIQDSTAYALNSKAFSIKSSRRPSWRMRGKLSEVQWSSVKLSLSASNSGGHGPSTSRPCGKTASKAGLAVVERC